LSKIEVNTVEPQCGTTLTLGASGDTVTLGSGASQSGFGRTGTVDWQTTKKTASFTAVSGEGYFIDTSSSIITMTLPSSPSAGDIVGLNDYARNFGTNNLTVARNGSNIQGAATNATFSTDGQSTMFVYVDSTKGWIPTEDQSTTMYGAEFIVATGGTITTSGNFKIHTFTGPGTFTVCSVGNPAGSTTVDYLVVAGGASGGGQIAGGGGGGGARMSSGTASGCYTASPLGACVSALPVSVTGYPITVGAGGASVVETGPTIHIRGNPGSTSTFSTITSTGGGGGGGNNSATDDGLTGGSGGGAGLRGPAPGGAGNTPPVSPPQGNPGGSLGSPSPTDGGGGGGGATAAGSGSTGSPPGSTAGAGGAGVTNAIRAACESYAGGGGGGGRTDDGVSGGPASAGGGRGAPYPGGPDVRTGEAGTANTGGGGGGGGYNGVPLLGISGAGGSGIVIIRYKFQ